MGKQLKFFCVATERISEEILKSRVTLRLLQTQREVRPEEIETYVAVTWNLVTLGLSPVPAFCLTEPDSHTMYEIVKRDIKALTLEIFGANANDSLGRVRNNLLIALALKPGRARRLFEVETRLTGSFSRGTLCSSVLAECSVDTTVVTLCSGQVEKFLSEDRVARDLGYSLRLVACDERLPLARRIQESIRRVCAPIKQTASWKPPAHRYHYQETTSASVHSVSGGQFESKR